MDVFLVPVAAERYELYCEEPDEPGPADGAPPTGFVRRMHHRFRETLAEAEHERRRTPEPGAPPPSFAARVKARSLRWIAESMAEQRLLWQLRGRDAATLVHPDDLTDAQAEQLLRRSLQRDWERHRFWLIVDALGGAVSVLLILVPGPNIIGYYFLFRIIGHFLSLRGARHGLRRTAWTKTAAPELTMLRRVCADPPEARDEIVRGIASALRLEHFAQFFQRAATP